MGIIRTTLIKTLDEIKDCKIYGIIGDNRYLIADSKAKIDIYTKENIFNGNTIKIHYASLIICGDIIQRMELDDNKILNISKYEITADIYDREGVYHRLKFNDLSGITVEDDIWTFEIKDYKQVLKLRDEF